jgi:hypothetical protein
LRKLLGRPIGLDDLRRRPGSQVGIQLRHLPKGLNRLARLLVRPVHQAEPLEQHDAIGALGRRVCHPRSTVQNLLQSRNRTGQLPLGLQQIDLVVLNFETAGIECPGALMRLPRFFQIPLLTINLGEAQRILGVPRVGVGQLPVQRSRFVVVPFQEQVLGKLTLDLGILRCQLQGTPECGDRA